MNRRVQDGAVRQDGYGLVVKHLVDVLAAFADLDAPAGDGDFTACLPVQDLVLKWVDRHWDSFSFCEALEASLKQGGFPSFPGLLQGQCNQGGAPDCTIKIYGAKNCASKAEVCAKTPHS